MSLDNRMLIRYQIAELGLLFHCARTLQGKIELLASGPSWKLTAVSMPGYSIKDPLVLYYRDPIEYIKFLLKKPLFSGCIQYQPRQDFNTSGGCVYGEWITSNGAWDRRCVSWCLISHILFTQKCFKYRLPSHTTLLTVTLLSDKTRLSAMTGDHVAHPLLTTLVNIDSTVRSSSPSHAFSLLALFSVPKFTSVKKGLHSILETNSPTPTWTSSPNHSRLCHKLRPGFPITLATYNIVLHHSSHTLSTLQRPQHLLALLWRHHTSLWPCIRNLVTPSNIPHKLLPASSHHSKSSPLTFSQMML